MINIIIVTVHPDDETLGCGGTILKHKKNGDKVHWLIITHLEETLGYKKEDFINRDKEIEAVTLKYNFDSVVRYNYPTTKLDDLASGDLIGRISNTFNEIKPTTIYLQHYGDAHSDHRITFKAVYACTKSFRYPFIKEVYTMETLSETEFSAPLESNVFKPNHFNNISDFMEKKIEIMKVYESEMGEHPFPRSERNIKALGTFRGAQCNAEYAEAFVCPKRIID
jgi:LmbE family N-acetylglucosaminyl deacetylase